MKITAKYSLFENYIPPRCRKPRQREVKKEIDVSIKEIRGELAPIAMITKTWESRVNKAGTDTHFGLTDTVYRLYKKKLYTPYICQSGNEIGTQYTVSDIMYRIHETGYPYDATEQERIKKIRYNVRQLVIIDGDLHIETGEPRYCIITFGLGHNHGGTGFFVNTFYNSNIHKDNYFNAFQRAEAIEYFNRVALGRGDTDSVTEEPKVNIQVLIPESVKCNPNKEHGNGCAFINSIESAISGSSSVMEAGLYAMALGVSE
ncbi:hypothetical protein LJB89_04545, partial [Tyzzerella sp. OttesenSCG-928-J15]|nr:hypothetical protein [Tyzzerella sp. OttesenSCG-928-J15]